MSSEMPSDYTPSTPDVETRYIRFRQLETDLGAYGVPPHQPGEFKRWYEAEIRKANVEALRDAVVDTIERYPVPSKRDDPTGEITAAIERFGDAIETTMEKELTRNE